MTGLKTLAGLEDFAQVKFTIYLHTEAVYSSLRTGYCLGQTLSMETGLSHEKFCSTFACHPIHRAGRTDDYALLRLERNNSQNSQGL